MNKGRTWMKNNILFILGMALYLLCSACSTREQYDITGTWHFYEYRDLGSYLDATYTFVGTEKHGQLDFGSVAGVSGEYTVDEDQIFFKITAGRGIAWNIHEYTGVFISNNLMKGILKGEHIHAGQVTSAWSGVWNARRIEGRAYRIVL